MGKKYIIEIEDDRNIIRNCGKTMLAVSIAIGKTAGSINTGIELTPYTEPDLEQVKADAYNDGYKAGREAEKVRHPDLGQVRKEAYEQGANDQRKQDEAEMMLLGSASVGAYES